MGCKHDPLNRQGWYCPEVLMLWCIISFGAGMLFIAVLVAGR